MRDEVLRCGERRHLRRVLRLRCLRRRDGQHSVTLVPFAQSLSSGSFRLLWRGRVVVDRRARRRGLLIALVFVHARAAVRPVRRRRGRCRGCFLGRRWTGARCGAHGWLHGWLRRRGHRSGGGRRRVGSHPRVLVRRVQAELAQNVEVAVNFPAQHQAIGVGLLSLGLAAHA